MDYTMSREKNMVMFQPTNKDKSYSLDVNTGIFYGLNGKPIKSCPSGFGKWIDNHYGDSNVTYLLFCLRSRPHNFNLPYGFIPTMDTYQRFANLFKTVDKLESLGFTLHRSYTLSVLAFIDKYFKNFAKYYREHPDCTLEEYKIFSEKELWLNEHKLVANGHLTEDIINMMYDNRDYYENDKTSLVAYYISHGLYDFFDIEDQTYRYDAVARMFSKISKYFSLCNKVGVEPQKEDMLRSYVNLHRTYRMNQQEIDIKRMADHYAEHPALNYENDLFKVVIPTSREDFLKEADAQRNCVYSMYLPRVLDGRTNVVFIRKKSSLDTPYITCEVTNDGFINQYLTFGNNRVNDADALQFKKEYRDYLVKNW